MSTAAEGDKKDQRTSTVDPLSVIAAVLEEQKKSIDMLGKGLLNLNQRLEAMEKRGGGGGSRGGPGELGDIIRGILGGGSESSMESFAKYAEGFARAADALERYRKPVSPYSLGDRLLMRAGARAVSRRIIYEGVKKRGESENEQSDREIDKELGFAEEEESEHVSE